MYNHLAQDPRWNLEVVYLSKRTPDRQWLVDESLIGFRYTVLPCWQYNPGNSDWTLQINPTVLLHLARTSPDVIITAGYNAPAHWAAWLYRLLKRKTRLVLWGSSTFLSSKVTSGLGWKLKRAFVGNCNSSVSYGSLATEYVSALGIPRSRIVTGCNVGSIDYFQEKVSSNRGAPNFASERKRYPSCVLIFAGKLLPRKGVDLLLNALTRVRFQDWRLWIVGDGPLRRALEGTASGTLRGKVEFHAFSQWDSLAGLYAFADIGVIPSVAEVGSIVLSEYLASGLFVIGSRHDASAHSLLVPGMNGIIVDPEDEDALAQSLSEAMMRCARGDLNKQAIAETLRGRSPKDYAEAVGRAIQIALN